MVTRRVWIPGAGMYSLENSDDASNPTRGSVTLKTAPLSRQAAEAENNASAEQRDQQLSTAGVSFKMPCGEVEEDNEKNSSLSKVQHNTDVTSELKAFLESAALCNLATIRKVHEDGQEKWKTTGDPTEIALQVFVQRFGYGKKTLEGEQGWKQTMEFPFDSSVKRMSMVYRKDDDPESLIFTKGAVERIIDLCICVGVGEDQERMTDELKEKILVQMNVLADQGLRVVAIARKFSSEDIHEHSVIDRTNVEKDLCLLGLAGLYDPPRLETKRAVQSCAIAGISVHMLTGDHPSTAAAIAREVGIIPTNIGTLPRDVAAALVKSATEFDAMSDVEIDALPTLPLVIARCAPETKVRMIEALHRRNKFAAMTGDGVNDAPSLQRADVGIAMGLNGSDVAKSASDIVLTDDNFVSIVNAIEEGRRMFDNIQKFVLHLLATNVGEVLLLVCGLRFQDKLGYSVFPLSPLAILWINMLTSSFPAFGLGKEEASSDIMKRPPHDNKKGVFIWQIITDMAVYGTVMGICTLMTFVFIIYGLGQDGLGDDCNKRYNASCDVVFRARAAVFAELTWMILIAAWEFKSLRRSMFALDPNNTTSRFPFFRDVYENRFLFRSVVLGALSVFPAVYIPGLNTIVFKHRGISWEWAPAVICVVVFVLAIEMWKLVKNVTGWFADVGTEEFRNSGRNGPLTLKQGFFTVARTRSKSVEKNGDQDSTVDSSAREPSARVVEEV